MDRCDGLCLRLDLLVLRRCASFDFTLDDVWEVVDLGLDLDGAECLWLRADRPCDRSDESERRSDSVEGEEETEEEEEEEALDSEVEAGESAAVEGGA